MYRTTVSVCTEHEEREESCVLASQIASLNEYVPRQRRHADRERYGQVTNYSAEKMIALLLCSYVGVVIAGPAYLRNTTHYKAGQVRIEDLRLSDVDGDEEAEVKTRTCSKDDVMIPINSVAKIGDTFWTCQQLSNGDVKAIKVTSPDLSNKTANAYQEKKIEESRKPAPVPPNEEMEVARQAELGEVMQWNSDENGEDDDEDALDWPSEPLCVDHKGKTHPLGEVWDEDSFTAKCMSYGADSVRPEIIGCIAEGVKIPINGTQTVGEVTWECAMLPNGWAELKSVEHISQQSVSALTIAAPPCIGRDGEEHKPGDIWSCHAMDRITRRTVQRPSKKQLQEPFMNDMKEDAGNLVSFKVRCVSKGNGVSRTEAVSCMKDGIEVPLNKERTIGAATWKCKLYSDGQVIMQLKNGRTTQLRKRLGSCRDESGNEYTVGEEWTELNTFVKCNIDVNGHVFKDVFACMKDGYKVLVNTVKVIDGKLWKCIKEENGNVAIIPSKKESRSLIVTEDSELLR